MVSRIDAIFTQGTFRPLEPLAPPEGTRVHLSVEEETVSPSACQNSHAEAAHPEDAADFAMEVRETGNAGV